MTMQNPIITNETVTPAETSNPLNPATGNTAAATRTISEEQFQQFLASQKMAKEYILAKKMKEHNAIFSSRRITVATRRVDLKSIAPDLDVLAYIEICKMKETLGQEPTASDTEIAAYVELWNFDGDLTIDAINQKLQAVTA